MQIKVEKSDEQPKEEPDVEEKEVKKEEGEDVQVKSKPPEAGADAELGRLVMTIDGEQKQLSFRQRDLLSTATMLIGDKVTDRRHANTARPRLGLSQTIILIVK